MKLTRYTRKGDGVMELFNQIVDDIQQETINVDNFVEKSVCLVEKTLVFADKVLEIVQNSTDSTDGVRNVDLIEKVVNITEKAVDIAGKVVDFVKKPADDADHFFLQEPCSVFAEEEEEEYLDGNYFRNVLNGYGPQAMEEMPLGDDSLEYGNN